jgi:hypothetical protein
VGAGLDAELVGAVVHDWPVAQGAGRQVEPGGEGCGVGAVVAEPAGFVAAGGDGVKDAGTGAAGVFAGPGQRQAGSQVRALHPGAGRPGHGGDGGFECPGDFPQGLALVVLVVAVVAFADVPAAVGSLAARPARLDGPRENSGTAVASRLADPS